MMDLKRKDDHYGKLKQNKISKKNKQFHYVLLLVKPFWTIFSEGILHWEFLMVNRGFHMVLLKCF